MLRRIAGLAPGFVVSACMTTSEPSSPCPELDLGRADPATFVAPDHAPLVAISVDEDGSFVASHPVCDKSGTCEVRRFPLEGLPGGAQVLVTASGRHVVAAYLGQLGAPQVRSWSVEPVLPVVGDGEGSDVGFDYQLDENAMISGEDGPAVLIGSLRGDEGEDWILARTIERPNTRRELVRFRPGVMDGWDVVAENVPDMLVVAVGEQHLLGRRIHSAGEETLYIVDVTGEGN